MYYPWCLWSLYILMCQKYPSCDMIVMKAWFLIRTGVYILILSRKVSQFYDMEMSNFYWFIYNLLQDYFFSSFFFFSSQWNSCRLQVWVVYCFTFCNWKLGIYFNRFVSNSLFLALLPLQESKVEGRSQSNPSSLFPVILQPSDMFGRKFSATKHCIFI